MSAVILTAGMLASCSPKTDDEIDQRVNLLTNSGFDESDTEATGWTGWSLSEKAEFSIVKGGSQDGSNCLRIYNAQSDSSVIFQSMDVTEDCEYVIEADVKYDVSSSGHGVLIGYTGYIGNTQTEETSALGIHTDKSDGWQHISCAFSISASKVNWFTAGVRLWESSGEVLVDNIKLYLVEKEETSKTYNLELSDTPNTHKIDAFGCEWDPHLYTEANTKRGVTEDDLDMIKSRIQKLGVARVRMMVLPEWFEPNNDDDDPNHFNNDAFDLTNDNVRTLFAYLDVCEELGIKVTLTWWGAQVYSGAWLSCEGVTDWVSAPNDLDEMAENIAFLIKYIREELKYTCVTDVILQNEPSYSYRVTGGAVDFDQYVEYYKTVRARLDREGMNDVALVGSDDSQTFSWFKRSANALKGVVTKLNSHNYNWLVTDYGLNLKMKDFIAPRVELAGDLPYYFGEFGDGAGIGAYTVTDADTYTRGLFISSQAVNTLKYGGAGALYWTLHSVYYYDGTNPDDGANGGLMMMGLFAFKDEDWAIRPMYYSWGLVCNNARPNSEVYDITGDTDNLLDCVAVKGEDGKWSMMLVNRSEVEQTVQIKAPQIGGAEMQIYQYKEDSLPTGDDMIASSGVNTPQSDTYTITLPAQSFTVLAQD